MSWRSSVPPVQRCCEAPSSTSAIIIWQRAGPRSRTQLVAWSGGTGKWLQDQAPAWPCVTVRPRCNSELSSRHPGRPAGIHGVISSHSERLTCPPLPSAPAPLALSRFSSVLGKERQTHFHTNGVRACSPGTRWNCKYFIFAWKPCTITPWPLSSLFYFVFSLAFFFSPPPLLSYLLTPLPSHANTNPPVL